MKALVIGFGSIGSRHARIVRENGGEVAVVSEREVDFPVLFHDLPQALSEWEPQCVIVANATSHHHQAVAVLAAQDFRGRVLIEKPIFAPAAPMPPNNFEATFVAYNLRFHPVLRALQRLLAREKVLSAQIYAGQFLPDWRPGTDYRTCYSAQSTGGGVLNDLSHELDYVGWILGPARRVVASGGHLSLLEIDASDVFALLMETERCPVVTIQLNYLDRDCRREIVVNTEEMTVKADLVAGVLQHQGNVHKFSVERDDTYRAQYEALRDGRFEELCSLEEGLEVMRLIGMAEASVRLEKWQRDG